MSNQKCYTQQRYFFMLLVKKENLEIANVKANHDNQVSTKQKTKTT